MTAFDLGSLHLITDRPGATPAPRHAVATGPVRPLDPGPWKPSGPSVFPTAVDPAAGPQPTTDDLLAACRQIRADLADAVTRSRRARGADTDLGRAA